MLIDFLDLKNLKIISQKKSKKKVATIFKEFLKKDNQILLSLSKNYISSYNKKFLKKYRKYKTINLFGMGGSILGSKAIYNFLKPKLKFNFIDEYHHQISNRKEFNGLNLVISKSGNTLETISNLNVITNKNKNIFITENKKSYLLNLAKALKSEVIHHNNFIGGRYSVLSEVGMLPAELMGFNPKKFRRLNEIVKDKKFLNSIIQNVLAIYELSKKNKRTNSIILNYDQQSHDLFCWYQQLVAESLGKKNKGILPIISSMPKDNHSVMQHYLDGPKNCFFTFFYMAEKNSQKIKNNNILKSHSFLKNKNLNDISFSQYSATQKVFRNKNIPYRSFSLKKRNEEILGELFIFFILETILLGKMMNINPFNQPSVELIKKETSKNLIKS